MGGSHDVPQRWARMVSDPPSSVPEARPGRITPVAAHPAPGAGAAESGEEQARPNRSILRCSRASGVVRASVLTSGPWIVTSPARFKAAWIAVASEKPTTHLGG